MLGSISLKVEVGHAKIAVLGCLPSQGLDAVKRIVVLGHGSGSDMNHPMLRALAEALAAAGALALRFNFPYREAGRKAPDPANKLEATWLAVLDALPGLLEGRKLPLVVGGKSMGGRIAAQLCAEDVIHPDALVFLGYPLHRPGNSAALRDGPIKKIDRPMLFLTGTKDRLCQLDLLSRVLGDRPNVTMHVLEGGDHSLEIAGKSAPPADSVRNGLVGVAVDWIARHTSITRRTSKNAPRSSSVANR